ncbi:MAG TPA: TIGR00730 family Rossman fold protein [Ilumatobacteraceae bacterium]|nr:TIGR00730 family Rossman fold protein [Ilumatobacteraceae bacterium]
MSEADAHPADELFASLLADLPNGGRRRLSQQLLRAAVDLVRQQPDLLDLKIAAGAVEELGEAFAMFSELDLPKVTVFGSARMKTSDPLYEAARTVAAMLAAEGWMVVTGAGPGIMQAAMEGAGRDRSIGVGVQLPFEQSANHVIAGDPKFVSMRYFFTRKLMLVKESKGFVCLPGGFGTLDEMFELITLTQTGKGLPVPIVLLDTPGDPYWETVDSFIREQLVARGLVAAEDTNLYLITEDCQQAVAEITGFYRNYDSLRYVGDTLVVRLRQAPTDHQLAGLNERFGHLCTSGHIHRADAFEPERKEHDRLDLQRIAFTFAKHGYGELRELIDELNSFVD